MVVAVTLAWGGEIVIKRHARYVDTDSNFKLRRRLVINRFVFYNLIEKWRKIS